MVWLVVIRPHIRLLYLSNQAETDVKSRFLICRWLNRVRDVSSARLNNLACSIQTFCLIFGVFQMKKSLIALAVLAASGASFAQSNVTLYGIVDQYFGSIKTDNGAGTNVTNTVLNSGGVDGNRWGLKGSEDLGGGLKANFKLEQGFNGDTGAVAANGTHTTGFTRYSYVGFSGGFGEVKLGVTGTAYDDVNGASDAAFDSALSPMNHIFVSTGYTWNPSNTLYYQAPDFGGFSGAISYSLGEDKTATVGASSITAFNLTYAAGPLAVQLGYQVQDIANTVALPNDVKFTRLGASYDFGVAKVKANYGKTTSVGNQNGFDATDYQIGVDYPVSAALTLSGSYAKSNDSNPAGVYEQSRKGYGIAAAYTLSKRTYVYGGYNANRGSQNGAGDAKLDILAVGVHHVF
jgi:predicted porin